MNDVAQSMYYNMISASDDLRKCVTFFLFIRFFKGNVFVLAPQNGNL